jgi:penicillin-binding protein 1A
MYELGDISEGEYEIAKNELENNLIGLQVSSSSSSTYTYFTDAVYEQVLEDIQTTYNYSYEAAENLLLNGGLKIYSTVDPVIQNALEEQAADDSNFPSQSSSAKAASEAMTEYTGEEVSLYA